MRIAERLARLERGRDTGPVMTASEIDAAAARYEGQLRTDGILCGTSVAEAVASWRRLVERAVEPWLQRVYADLSPTDLYL